MLSRIKERILNEPVLVLNAINAIIAIVVAFGIEMTVEQKTAIIGLSTALLNIIARSVVTPVRKL